MFAIVRRPEPQRRSIGAPGISEEQYDRLSARVRDERIIFAISRLSGVKSPDTTASYALDSIMNLSQGTRP